MGAVADGFGVERVYGGPRETSACGRAHLSALGFWPFRGGGEPLRPPGIA